MISKIMINNHQAEKSDRRGRRFCANFWPTSFPFFAPSRGNPIEHIRYNLNWLKWSPPQFCQVHAMPPCRRAKVDFGQGFPNAKDTILECMNYNSPPTVQFCANFSFLFLFISRRNHIEELLLVMPLQILPNEAFYQGRNKFLSRDYIQLALDCFPKPAPRREREPLAILPPLAALVQETML